MTETPLTQSLSPLGRGEFWSLGYWILFDYWCLEFGASIQLCLLGHPFVSISQVPVLLPYTLY
jgi:hypothetical protein